MFRRDMFVEIRSHIRYWSFLVLKLAAAALGAAGSLWFLNLFWLPYTPFLRFINYYKFPFDLVYTSLVGVWFLFAYGLFYLAIWDQKYRCRTCLRRLRMPIETGSWGYMLQLGRPQIEYICAYGHGRLNVEEVQISGAVSPEWTQQGDMWDELFAETKAGDGGDGGDGNTAEQDR
jgi:hypothetical protein